MLSPPASTSSSVYVTTTLQVLAFLFVPSSLILGAMERNWYTPTRPSINDLPSELLLRVFDMVVSNSAEHLVIPLLSVSRFWYQTAITPSLWTQVNVNGSEQCVRAYLERSQPHELSFVSYSTDCECRRNRSRLSDYRPTERIAKLLCSEIQRVQSIVFLAGEFTDLAIMELIPGEVPQQLSELVVSELVLRDEFEYIPRFGRQFLEHTDLRKLSLDGLISWTYTMHIHNVARLSLTGEFDHCAADLVNILEKCPGLETLELICYELFEGRDHTCSHSNRIVLSELTRLTVKFHPSDLATFKPLLAQVEVPFDCQVDIGTLNDRPGDGITLSHVLASHYPLATLLSGVKALCLAWTPHRQDGSLIDISISAYRESPYGSSSPSFHLNCTCGGIQDPTKPLRVDTLGTLQYASTIILHSSVESVTIDLPGIWKFSTYYRKGRQYINNANAEDWAHWLRLFSGLRSLTVARGSGDDPPFIDTASTRVYCEASHVMEALAIPEAGCLPCPNLRTLEIIKPTAEDVGPIKDMIEQRLIWGSQPLDSLRLVNIMGLQECERQELGNTFNGLVNDVTWPDRFLE